MNVEIINLDSLEDTILVDFDGVFVEYTPGDFSTITHAYCISIHKAQGNEFPIVIILFNLSLSK